MAVQSHLRPILVRMLEGRVGSTLLMQLFATSSEVAFERIYPFENSYLTYAARLTGAIDGVRPDDRRVGEFLSAGAGQVGPPPFPATELDCTMVASASLRGVWEAFSAGLVARAPGAQLYAEKFWGDVGPLIAAGLDPIVIDLIRDPRDVVASIRAFNAKTGRPAFGRSLAADDRQHLRRLIIGMGMRFDEFAADLPVRRLSLRYEDLVADLEGQSARLSDWLGVDISPQPVLNGAAEMSHHCTSVSAAGSIGRWRNDLSRAEIDAIERRLTDPMRAHGYMTSTDV